MYSIALLNSLVCSEEGGLMYSGESVWTLLCGVADSGVWKKASPSCVLIHVHFLIQEREESEGGS